MPAKISPTASVDASAVIGDGSSVWGDAQIRGGAKLGKNCIIGTGAYIDSDVVIGDNCKIQNLALVYHPAKIANGVFIGPAAVLTKIGAWALIAAGAVVNKDVPDFALMAGVPAKRIRWVGRAGLPLESIGDNRFRCPTTGATYKEQSPDKLIEEGV